MTPEDTQTVLGTQSGRRFTMSILKQLGFLTPQIWSSEEHLTIVNAGTVGKANSLFNQMLEAQPEQTLLMVREDRLKE